MSIWIDREKCIGCRRCIEVCPGNLIKQDADAKARIRQPKDCWGCTSCIKECPKEAIAFFLGADIGGRGSKMTTYIEGDYRYWMITEPTGLQHTVKINQKDANKY